MLLLNLLATTSTSPHRVQGLLPPGTRVAHKAGTSGTYHGLTRGTNDIGLVTLPSGRHLAIAVFVADSSADEMAREGVIAKIARAAWDRWSSDH
jgi:beta-lactamase class A